MLILLPLQDIASADVAALEQQLRATTEREARAEAAARKASHSLQLGQRELSGKDRPLTGLPFCWHPPLHAY